MPKAPNYERLLMRATSLLIDILKDTASNTQGGGKSTTECMSCERVGVHKPELRCRCSCHVARAFIAELSNEVSEKAA